MNFESGKVPGLELGAIERGIADVDRLARALLRANEAGEASAGVALAQALSSADLLASSLLGNPQRLESLERLRQICAIGKLLLRSLGDRPAPCDPQPGMSGTRHPTRPDSPRALGRPIDRNVWNEVAPVPEISEVVPHPGHPEGAR